MGNSASLQQTLDQDAPLPEDLYALSDLQLKRLWEDRPLSLEEIKQAAKSLTAPEHLASGEKEDVYLPGLYYLPAASSSHSSTRRPDPTNETALAVRLCQLLNELALLRFRLVPTRLKEDKFWMATLLLLKERLVEYNAARDDNLDDEEEELLDNNNNHKSQNAKMMNGSGGKKNHNSTTDGLERQIKIQKVQIAKLKRQVQELEAKLEMASRKNSSTQQPQPHNHTNNNNHKAPPHHKGSWSMDPDSKEFLEYPEEVKENLRAEKQKRLEQVRKEMKFILDSDEIHHTNGKWDCCGQDKFHASCSM